MHDKGEHYWPDGRKYIGHYREDKKEGYGEYFWNDGKIYKGFWKSGYQDGYGKLIKNNEEKIGLWKNGKRIKWLNEEELKNVEHIFKQIEDNEEEKTKEDYHVFTEFSNQLSNKKIQKSKYLTKNK